MFSFHLGSDYHIHKIVDSTCRFLKYEKVEQITGGAPYWVDFSQED